jgi:hypothetical protein
LVGWATGGAGNLRHPAQFFFETLQQKAGSHPRLGEDRAGESVFLFQKRGQEMFDVVPRATFSSSGA